jgi:tetratricopeptide (TPR) repeat protein
MKRTRAVIPLLFALALGPSLTCESQNAAAPASQQRNSSTAVAPSFEHATRLYREGQLQAALAEYSSLTADGPNGASAYVGLARTYIKMGKIEDADIAAAKALELAPDLTDAHVARGEVYFRQGKIGEAEQEFVAMIRKGTLNGRAYLGEGRVSTASSFYKQAKYLFNMAYGLDPTDPEIRRARAATFTRPERIKDLEKSLPADANADTAEQSSRRRLLGILKNDPDRLLPCRMVTNASSMQTDLWKLIGEPKQIKGCGLRVHINEAPAMLVVETARPGIVIDRKIADQANVKRVRDINVNGLGDQGPTPGYLGIASSLKIANLEFKDCPVEVVEKNSALGQDGVIGTDVFSHFLVDLDFANESFKLSELPPAPNQPAPDAALKLDTSDTPPMQDRYIAPQMRSFTPLFRFGDQLLVSTKINDSAGGLFLLATGSTRSSISTSLVKEFTKVTQAQNRRENGFNGEVKNFFLADDVTLTFGTVKQRNLDMTAVDLSRISNNFGTEICGILGLSSLQKMDVKIDYRDGLIEFNFDASRWR